jgi:hypothetical protein
MKYGLLWLLILPVFLLFGCQKDKDHTSSLKEATFEDLSGQRLECWKHVIAPVDFSNLAFYKHQFEKVKGASKDLSPELAIPKVLHFIWLGPKDFPRESIGNVVSWMKHHPGWKVKLWTDRMRPLPEEGVEEIVIDHMHFHSLQACYEKTQNYGEKSDLLRYEILFQEGGVYIDHDVKCFKSLDDLIERYELVCGLELPADTPIASSIHATNSLIASRPFHPILERCIKWLPPVWDEIEKLYPGSDKDMVIRRVASRTFRAFSDSVRELSGVATHDLVAPAYYFSAPSDGEAVYARHLYAGSWFQNENPFEKMARHRLMMLSKKVNKILLFMGVAAGLNLIVIGFFFFSLRKKLKNLAR